MAENEGDGAGMQPNGMDTAAQVGLIAQYVKDLSFENPGAPAIYQSQVSPAIEVQFNIAVNTVGEDVHEVAMKIEVRATGENGSPAFMVELVYAGLFGARNVAPDQLQGFLFGEAPRLLFPFARRIVAETVRDGNFLPLLLDPIDFTAMYLAQAEQAQTLAQSEPAGQA